MLEPDRSAINKAEAVGRLEAYLTYVPSVPALSATGAPLDPRYSMSPVAVMLRGLRSRLAAVKTRKTPVPLACEAAVVPSLPRTIVHVVVPAPAVTRQISSP